MAQEKQNTLRILKANPAKPQKRSSLYVIAGFVGGIILSCGFFGFYLNTTTADEDIDYPNQINEQEMSALFKHSVNSTTNLNTHTPNSSPFANLGQEPKSASKAVVSIEKRMQKHHTSTPTAQPLAQGVVKPALLDQLDKEAELAQPQAQTTHPSSPATH